MEDKTKGMKKRLVMSLLALTLVCQGCGQLSIGLDNADEAASDTGADEAASKEDEEKDKEDTEDKAAESASDNSSDSASMDSESADNETDSDSDNSSDDLELTDTSKFDAFLENEDKVIFDEAYYYNVSTDISCGFEDGKEFTLDEIVTRAEELTKTTNGNDGDPEVTTHYLDCGLDGVSELELVIHLPGGEDDRYDEGAGDEYDNIIVIQESEGELFAKFYTQSGYYDSTCINDRGYISTGGPAYSGIGSESAGYLDGDCEFYYYYGCEYFLEATDYTNYQETTNGRTIYTSEGDWSNVCFEQYSFDIDGKDSFTVYTIFDGDFPLIYEEDYPDDNPYIKALDDAGIEAVSYAELKSILDKRKIEIGLSSEIMNHIEESQEIVNAMYRFDCIINGDETFTDLYSLEEETFEEFCEGLSEAGEPEIRRVTYVDLDGQNGKELILDLGTNAGVYLILSHIDGKFYGKMTTTRCFEELQNDGTYRGSGGAGDAYYMRATISKDAYTEEYIAEYHDDVFTVDGEEYDDYEGWLSENFSDPAYWWEKK